MREARIGCILPASVHQAIADDLPARLEYYEHWLSPTGLRDGTIGVAAFRAVLRFLRQEAGAYPAVVVCAGQYAATWFVDGLTPLRRGLPRWLPARLRARAALRLGRRFVRWSDPRARASSSLRRGRARVEVRRSAFCEVREPVDGPQCAFYASALVTVLSRFDVEASAQVGRCRATGADGCTVDVGFGSASSADRPR